MNGERSKSVLKFSLTDHVFEPVIDMNHAKTAHGSTIAGDKLYAIGYSIEMLDISSTPISW